MAKRWGRSPNAAQLGESETRKPSASAWCQRSTARRPGVCLLPVPQPVQCCCSPGGRARSRARTPERLVGSGGMERPWDVPHGRRGYRPAASQVNRPAKEPAPGDCRYRCSQFGSYEQAQQLLRMRHTNLDPNGDWEVCESLRRSRSLRQQPLP